MQTSGINNSGILFHTKNFFLKIGTVGKKVYIGDFYAKKIFRDYSGFSDGSGWLRVNETGLYGTRHGRRPQTGTPGAEH
jgi:hypothetical protein